MASSLQFAIFIYDAVNWYGRKGIGSEAYAHTIIDFHSLIETIIYQQTFKIRQCM